MVESLPQNGTTMTFEDSGIAAHHIVSNVQRQAYKFYLPLHENSLPELPTISPTASAQQQFPTATATASQNSMSFEDSGIAAHVIVSNIAGQANKYCLPLQENSQPGLLTSSPTSSAQQFIN